MKEMKRHPHHFTVTHKQVQMVITTGTISGAALTLMLPDLSAAALAMSLLTNLIWIWAE